MAEVSERRDREVAPLVSVGLRSIALMGVALRRTPSAVREADRVVILRSGGPVELKLHRPEEPRPVVRESPSTNGVDARPSQPAVPTPDESSPRRRQE